MRCLIVSFVVSLAWAGNNALACDGCFQHCYDYVNTIKDLKEPSQSIALALWFGAYGTETNRNDQIRQIPSIFAADAKIAAYHQFWNAHVSNSPITAGERATQGVNPKGLESITMPLPAPGNSVDVFVAAHYGEVRFALSHLTLEPAGVDGVVANLSLQFFAVECTYVGGAMESGVGIASNTAPRLILKETIDLTGTQIYDLKTQEHLLKSVGKKRQPVAIVLRVSVAGVRAKSDKAKWKVKLVIFREKQPEEK